MGKGNGWGFWGIGILGPTQSFTQWTMEAFSDCFERLGLDVFVTGLELVIV